MLPYSRYRRLAAVLPIALIASGCSRTEARPNEAPAASSNEKAAARAMVALDSASRNRQPNETGRIPILEYHLVGTKEGRWEREHTRFRRDLALLYERGYRPITVADLVSRRIDLPRGLSPVVFTFDDASPSQFRYVERDGQLVVDSTSAIGIWLDFQKAHPDWESKATFCVLSGAEAGRAFFGDRNIEGQKSAWRHAKLKFLAEQGFELCNHTLWHAQLSKYDDAVVQEQIARLALAVDSAVPGYRVRTMALPLGEWPRNTALAAKGAWTDARTKRVVAYDHAAVLLVAGEPVPSPFDPAFDPLRLERVQVYGNSLERTLDWLEKSGRRYVSDGDSTAITAARVVVAIAGADGRQPSAP
ncbi:MAG TPA: polysaccharide deacetylase family protein [Gemmatimonadaceae bacterium]|nr:polysaccharide deacetylase family protein [Gemmatimonadaceae bacterium]